MLSVRKLNLPQSQRNEIIHLHAVELQARLMLAQSCLDAQKLDEARRAASIAGLKVPVADDDDRELWDELSALRRAIEVKR